MTTITIVVNQKAVLADRVSCRTRRQVRDIIKKFAAETRQFNLAYKRTVKLPIKKAEAFKKAVRKIKHVSIKA